MKKRINLFKVRRFQNSPFAILFSKQFLVILNIAGLLFFAGFTFFIFLIIQTKGNIQKVEQEKQTYLKYLLANKETEAKLRYFKAKQMQFNKYLKDDARFLPYYNVLVEALKSATNSPILETVNIDKSRKTNFIVKFNDFESSINFLKYTESPLFLESFQSLVLTGFNLIESNEKKAKTSYQFSFNGVFKEINESPL